MSKGRFTTRREAAIKQIKAKAHKEQTTFKNAQDDFSWRDIKRLGLDKPCCPICAGTVGLDTPRIHSNARKHASRHEFRDDTPMRARTGCDGCDDFVYTHRDQPSRSKEPMTVSLGDVKTKQAKAKGVRKEYEVIQSASQRVIVLDDFGDDAVSDSGDDDWERIESVISTPRRNYASVVRG